MKKTDFNFPISKPGLIAAKAAGIVGGDSMYWDVFDRIQNKLFVENKNIEDNSVLEEAVKETDISFKDWQVQFEKKETEGAVLKDFEIVRSYGVNSAPTLVINNKYAISGAQPEDVIIDALTRISKEEGVPLNKLQTIQFSDESGTCSIIDGKWNCD